MINQKFCINSLKYFVQKNEFFVFSFWILSIFDLYSTTGSKIEFGILLSIIRFVGLSTVLIVLILKTRNKLHILWLKEIPSFLVFFYTLHFYLLISVAQQLAESNNRSPISQIPAGIVAAYLSFLLVSYQAKPWISSDVKRKNSYRIDKLRSKARLKNYEWQHIKPMLVNSARNKNKTDWLWRITEIIIVIGLASILDAYAGRIADIIQNLIPIG